MGTCSWSWEGTCSWKWERMSLWRWEGTCSWMWEGTYPGSVGISRGLVPVGRVWEKQQPSSVCYAYILSPGPSSPFTGSTCMSPLDLFSCFFTHTVWNLLVTETNHFASQTSSTSAHARPWHDTTVAEMMAFTGILIIMGIIQLPQLEMYWQN